MLVYFFTVLMSQLIIYNAECLNTQLLFLFHARGEDKKPIYE